MRQTTTLTVVALTPRRPWTAALLAVVFLMSAGGVARPQDALSVLPLEDFSPGFLGMYRKVMRIEDDIRRFAAEYQVDFDLARAVCLYESGGDEGLRSGSGARGYFQVMPSTYRTLRVDSNIEAGVKYLAQMIGQFDREDRAIAAYNAGPGRIDRGGAIPLETLQYVIGVGQYRTILKLYDASIRYHASRIQLVTVQDGVDWQRLSDQLGVPEWELRMHNPFLASSRLRAGQVIAYPPEHRRDLLRPVPGGAEYRMRHGDNYLILAFSLGIAPDELRDANDLWQIQAVSPGTPLRIPFSVDRLQLVRAALGVPASEPRLDLDIEPTVADLGRPPEVEPGSVAVASPPRPAAPRVSRPIAHRVVRGDTLASIARRYDTTINAIQQANRMGRRTSIRTGQRLRIPPTDAVRATN